MTRLAPRTVAVCVASLLVACADPLREAEIEALGPESPSVEPGPRHRPGQPCVAPCHDGQGPGDSTFSLGGTVYQTSDRLEPLPDALVHFIDSAGQEFSTATNCAGNFFVDPSDFTPAPPFWVTVEFGGLVVPMSSAIFREGGCAACHRDPADRASPGHVYLIPGPFDFPPVGCP